MINNILKFLFILFIGILVALFVGVGIDTFYPRPERPKYPERLALPVKITPAVPEKGTLQTESSIKFQKEQKEYKDKNEAYKKDLKKYSRNASVISIVASIIIVVISLFLLAKVVLISDGLLLGSMGALLYGLILGFQSDNSIFRFIIVSAGLIIIILVSYFKFVKKDKK